MPPALYGARSCARGYARRRYRDAATPMQPRGIKKAPPRRGFDTAVMCNLLLRRTDNFDFHATIRCEAGDECLVVLLVATRRNRLTLALAFRVDTVGFDALADQVCLDSLCTTQRQAIVVLVRTDTVRVTRCDHNFQVQVANLRCEIVKLCLAAWLQDGLVEVEQSVSLVRNLLALDNRSRCRCDRRLRCLGYQRAIALCVGRCRGPERVTPAKLVRAVHPHVFARAVHPVVVHSLTRSRDRLRHSRCSHNCGSCNEREL